jgi:xanthine dehydrogenase accessory factor
MAVRRPTIAGSRVISVGGALRFFGDAAVVAAFARWRSEGKACAIATVVATRSSAPRPIGSKLVISEDGRMAGSVSGGCVENAVALEARTVIASGDPILLHYGFTADQAFEVGLPCGGEIDVFLEPGPCNDSVESDLASDSSVLLTVVEGPQIGHKLLVRPGVGAVGIDDTSTLAEIADRVQHSGVLDWHGQKVFAEIFRPAPRLVIVGAIDIAEALAALASSLGWRTVCVDPRAALATRERVPSAYELRIEWPDQALKTLDLDEETAVVVLLHDEKFIVPTLVSALAGQAFYVGVLGSRRAQSLWRSKLIGAGVATEELARMHGPAGLDIGAATPTEVALSILAEMLAIRSGRRGGFLRDGTGAIHEQHQALPAQA